MSPSASSSEGSTNQRHPPNPTIYETYRYTPTERNIFDPSPYKSHLLPLWRFRSPEVARESANQIWDAFLEYEKQDDFVGMDNARKFLQMGMTRAKRYANWRGGRKYDYGTTAKESAKKKTTSRGSDRPGEDGQSKVRSGGVERIGRKRKREDIDSDADGGKDRRQKEEASQIFKDVWERSKNWDGYLKRKEDFLQKQRVVKNDKNKSAAAGQARKVMYSDHLTVAKSKIMAKSEASIHES